MTDPKHLSNKELVDKFYQTCNPTCSPEEFNRRYVLKDEILRRLEEPWREKVKKEKFFDEEKFEPWRSEGDCVKWEKKE